MQCRNQFCKWREHVGSHHRVPTCFLEVELLPYKASPVQPVPQDGLRKDIGCTIDERGRSLDWTRSRGGIRFQHRASPNRGASDQRVPYAPRRSLGPASAPSWRRNATCRVTTTPSSILAWPTKARRWRRFARIRPDTRRKARLPPERNAARAACTRAPIDTSDRLVERSSGKCRNSRRGSRRVSSGTTTRF